LIRKARPGGAPVAYHPPLDVWALLLTGPLALLAANLLAAWPGQRAARLSSAQILRAEGLATVCLMIVQVGPRA
jgi:hypothetical protein